MERFSTGTVRDDCVRQSVCRGTFNLLVEDDGNGFDLSGHPPGDENRGIGLAGIGERAALGVEIESEKGKGTTVFVQLPLQLDEAGR